MMNPGMAGNIPPQNQHQMNIQHQQHLQQQQQQHAAQQHAAQVQQQQQQSQGQEDKLVAKAKELIGPLKEKWAATLKEGANKLNHANNGATPSQEGQFESNLEDFYAICDQIELNLKSAIDCLEQMGSSTLYMSIAPHPSRYHTGAPGEPEFLSYPQYISTARQQVKFSGEVRQLLAQAAQDVVAHKQ